MSLNKTKNILWYCIVASLLVEGFFDRGTILRKTLLVIGLVALIVVVILEIVLFMRKKQNYN